MSRVFVLILVVFSAVAVSACGSPSSSSVSRPSPTPTPTSVASGLEALLITDVPTGFVQQADNVGNTGPSDLAKAASDDGGANATAVLTADGFEGGYQRLWTDSTPTNLIAYIYVFSNPTGAANYEQRLASALNSQPSGSVTHPFTVNGVTGATGVYGTASGSPVVAVVVAKGDYLVQIAMQGPNATVATTTTVFQEQLARFSS
jgi:hypothetical protein